MRHCARSEGVRFVKLIATLFCALFLLQGCAVFGVAMVGAAGDNVALADKSYTNKGLDRICDRWVEGQRDAEGNCE